MVINSALIPFQASPFFRSYRDDVMPSGRCVVGNNHCSGRCDSHPLSVTNWMIRSLPWLLDSTTRRMSHAYRNVVIDNGNIMRANALQYEDISHAGKGLRTRIKLNGRGKKGNCSMKRFYLRRKIRAKVTKVWMWMTRILSTATMPLPLKPGKDVSFGQHLLLLRFWSERGLHSRRQDTAGFETAQKRPPNISVKKECDPSTPRAPLLNAGKGLLAKNKKGKVNQDNTEVSDVQVHSSEKLSVKSNLEEIKTRSAIHEIDTRLRPPEERRKITPPSPQRRAIHREPPPALRKDHPDIRKYTDGMRKLRNAALPNQSIEITNANANKCKHANEKLQNLPTDPVEKDDGFMASATVDSNACTVNQGDLGIKETLVQNGHRGNMIDCIENMNKSHESEDFDCPCCDRNSVMMDETGLSDIEVKMFTSCDVIAPVEEALNELKDVKEDCDNKNQTGLIIVISPTVHQGRSR
ncbi:uncharacterized protein CEXT_549471 [Caerostris extrusa]|uniref:Uncharacterized protein n=1 Tax=Caerostris extrusa TaxID=172846 RepID=A0AAV4XTD2_CAEEX|nr:uncharacterized protein CEXT_549471 [Caerostris extrusa]